MNHKCACLGEWSGAMLAGLFAALPAPAAGLSGNGTLSVVWENDVFARTDQYYSNGLQVSWVPDGGGPPPAWAVNFARLLPWFPRESEIRHGYAFGQSMYTASDITLAEPPAGEPPYAGWLYGSIGMSAWTGRQADQLTLTLGIVGPASLAEPAQKNFHKIVGADEPRGWDSQLENEPGVVLTYLRRWRGRTAEVPGGFELDLTPHVGGALGNVYTYANAGLILRYGKHLPQDDAPLRIQPGTPGFGNFVSADDLGWYVFAGFDSQAVARNIFLDGNTFRDSRSVDKKPLVGDFQIGFSLTWRTARLSYAQILRTREYEGQPDQEGLGAVSLTVPLP